MLEEELVLLARAAVMRPVRSSGLWVTREGRRPGGQDQARAAEQSLGGHEPKLFLTWSKEELGWPSLAKTKAVVGGQDEGGHHVWGR